jgi:hypothetical protein
VVSPIVIAVDQYTFVLNSAAIADGAAKAPATATAISAFFIPSPKITSVLRSKTFGAVHSQHIQDGPGTFIALRRPKGVG